MLITESHKSSEYRKHITDPEYGGKCVEYSGIITTIINNLEISEVLDYGAGKGELPKNIAPDHRVAVHLYDPAMPSLSESPEPREFVVCIDTLNYVESDCIDYVLDDLVRVTKKIIFIQVTEDERKMEWWLPKIMDRFSVQSLVRSNIDFYVIAEAN